MRELSSNPGVRPSAKRAAAIERPQPLHIAVIERLRNMIVEGELSVGERLNDARLAALLSVSRTPIREAIKLLTSEGLAELIPGRGARVSAFSTESVGELLEVIAGLERHACELAAELMSEREFDKIRRLHDRMTKCFAEGDRKTYFKLNQDIHIALVAASRNTILQGVHSSLLLRARRARYAALSAPSRWEEAIAEHEQLMVALLRRDGQRAGEIMRDHDRRTAQALLEGLRPDAARDDVRPDARSRPIFEAH